MEARKSLKNITKGQNRKGTSNKTTQHTAWLFLLIHERIHVYVLVCNDNNKRRNRAIIIHPETKLQATS